MIDYRFSHKLEEVGFGSDIDYRTSENLEEEGFSSVPV